MATLGPPAVGLSGGGVLFLWAAQRHQPRGQILTCPHHRISPEFFLFHPVHLPLNFFFPPIVTPHFFFNSDGVEIWPIFASGGGILTVRPQSLIKSVPDERESRVLRNIPKGSTAYRRQNTSRCA